MAKYLIPATWQTQGVLEIEAESFEKAVQLVDAQPMTDSIETCNWEPVKYTLDLEESLAVLAELNHITETEVKQAQQKFPTNFRSL